MTLQTLSSGSLESLMKLKYNGMKALLAQREMTQTDVAEAMDVHRNTVASWLNGSRSANVESIIDMLRVMGYSYEDIFNMKLGQLCRLENE